MQSGWIKFYRKTWEEHPDITMTGAWVWLLCAAEYEGHYRGALVTTISSLALEWCMSWKKAKNILRSWIEDKMIRVDPVYERDIDFSACTAPSVFAEGHVEAKVHKGIKITILNYDKYQGGFLEEDEAKGEASGAPCPEELRVLSEPSAPTPKEAKSKKKGRKKTEPHPRYQEVVGFFFSEFEKTQGRPYVGQAKDFAAISRLLKNLEADDLMARMSEYLRDTEPFIVKNGHTVAFLQTRINSYGKPNFGDKKTEGSDYLPSNY